ncbi:hypothetical protein [Pontibacter amylolyticus]|uniref:Secreted protein n=1 Tax=Pontibacter amylolyticus TaxID=1424080 RepID=A0ABQ1W4U8_9BACT|nr:hypothetical protein [Pontibacter amylolyticus]GGG12984.1 hypothetical protein GCM10011323_16770 [Pontibacter amylolyticus]
MKRLAIILCVLCVLVQPLSKQGIMMVYQLNRDYIASELCENRFIPGSDCQGKCHLRKELKKDTERKKEAPRQQRTVDMVVYKAEMLHLALAIPQEEENERCLYLAGVYASPDFSIFHPPSFMA